MNVEQRLSFALGATRTGLWSYDRDSGSMTCDESVEALIGSAGGSLPVTRFLDLFDADDVLAARRLIESPARALGAAHELEFHVRRLSDGTERWIAIRATADEETGEILGSARDVTAIKRYDAQVHMLMREVTHRSKNLLAIIQAMARQTVKDSLSAAEFETRFSARLRGLSFSHELLASQDWRGASLRELAEGHLSALRDRHGPRVQIAGPTVFIRPEAAQNVGLALNELGTNAMRYGALSGSQGTVRLEWHIDADDTGPHALHMIWTESGGDREVRPPSHRGFGHNVMERVVARALNAHVAMNFAPSGLRWSLQIPVSHIASDTGV